MAPSQSKYDAYKRDTHLLTYWVILTSNLIITAKPHQHDPSIQLNDTGCTTVAGFLQMANLIAQNESCFPVPPCIFRLFRSVIKARSAAWNIFQQTTSENPDPVIEKSNISHKFFIDSLDKAFKLLGGEKWESSPDAQRPDTGDDAEDEIRKSVRENRFSMLDDNEDRDESEEGSPKSSSPPAATQNPPKTRRSRKGKGKDKKSNGSGSKHGSKHGSLETYRIIEDDNGIDSEFQMAVFMLLSECSELRDHLANLWARVAHKGFNSATAGFASNMAIAILKRSEVGILRQFSHNFSYEAVLEIVMPRDSRDSREPLSVVVYASPLTAGGDAKVDRVKVDGRELLLMYAYYDFIDFIADFQLNNNGKMSKALAKKLGRWEPEFDLARVPKMERRNWRRAYTINWLYDLVNRFTSAFLERSTSNYAEWDPSKVEWTFKARWNDPRRLFGLDEFAAFVCSMA